MKINLPCEIVRDLLPSYIDELTSEMSTKAVDEHLKECENCQDILGEMKRDLVQEKQAEGGDFEGELGENLQRDSTFDEDKKVIQKINRKINRRLKFSIFMGLFSVILVFIAIYILYNEALKKVSIDDIEVTAKVYEMDELEIEYGTSMVTEKTGGEERSYEEKIAILHIPESYMSSVEVTASSLEEKEYLTVISLKSPYFLNRYTRDFQKQGDDMVLYLGGFRTTFLKNQPFSADQMTHSMEFEKIDKIAYIHEDGTETVLWENEE